MHRLGGRRDHLKPRRCALNQSMVQCDHQAVTLMGHVCKEMSTWVDPPKCNTRPYQPIWIILKFVYVYHCTFSVLKNECDGVSADAHTGTIMARSMCSVCVALLGDDGAYYIDNEYYTIVLCCRMWYTARWIN